MPSIARIATTLCILAGAAAADTNPATPTFNRDVLPILQKHCQICHRPGAVAPTAFVSYQDTRPWAKAIKAAVLEKKMPPWPADPLYGRFANDRSLPTSAIEVLAAWADTGAVEGDQKDRPAAVQWPDGWAIPPDAVRSLPKPVTVPAKGAVELTSFTIPGFKEDTWITSIEIRPGNPAVVHHVSLAVVPHTDDVRYGVPEVGVKERDSAGVQVNHVSKSERLGAMTGLEATYDPGTIPADFRLYRAGKLIPAGSDLVLQMHYTPNGTATTDQTQIGFTITKEKPERQFVTLVPTSLRDGAHFHIPAHAANWETRTAIVFEEDVEIAWLMPHMHLRGKDMTYRLVYPNGDVVTLLKVRWDFNWQVGYYLEKPIPAPKSSRLEVTAHFDNSANNPLNPNPNTDVWWGDQTWEEMMVPWLGVLARPDASPSQLVKYAKEIRKSK